MANLRMDNRNLPKCAETFPWRKENRCAFFDDGLCWYHQKKPGKNGSRWEAKLY